MGLAQALRAVAGQFGGAPGDDDADDDRSQQARQRRPKPLALARPPHIEFSLVTPQEFDDARQIAARLRADSPVIVDLRSCGRDLAKRLTDFCSGLSYALEGSLQYIGEGVVLLAPHHVELSSDAPGALQERRFFNQA